MTALKFNKVKNLPTSGYNVGDVFFVSSEKKIYIRTASGWEEYNGGFTTAEKTKLAGIEAGANKTVITNNLTTYTTGTALDASQGRILNNKIKKTAYTEFSDLTKLNTNLGSRLLYTGSTTTISSPIVINSNIIEIDFNGMNLKVGSLEKTGISVITGHNHCVIKNLKIDGSWTVNSDTVNNIIDTFAGVENVAVGVTINGTHYGIGFHNCQRLINCKSSVVGANITEGRAYNYCEYLYMCRVGDKSKGTGFFHCTSMDSCDIFNGGCTGSELKECSNYTKVSYYVNGNRKYFSDTDNITVSGTNLNNIVTLSETISTASEETINNIIVVKPGGTTTELMNILIGSEKNIFGPTVAVRDGYGKLFMYDGHYIGIGCTTKYAAYLAEQADISTEVRTSIEAITIKTGNTPDDKTANVAAIKAYVNNLKTLGVDITSSFIIPIHRYDNNHPGTLVKVKGTDRYTGWFNIDNRFYPIVVAADGTYVETLTLTTDGNYSSLNTTSKYIIGAINEVNTLAKGKQDTLTSGTNIKTVNGQSLLGSGNIAISGGGAEPYYIDISTINEYGKTLTASVFQKLCNAVINKRSICGYKTSENGETVVCPIVFAVHSPEKQDTRAVGLTPESVTLIHLDEGSLYYSFISDASVEMYEKIGLDMLTVTNFDNNSGRPINIQDTELNDVLYVENSEGPAYKGPQLTIIKYNNGSGTGMYDAYKTDVCGKGIQIGIMSGGNYVCGTTISSGNIKLEGSDVVTKKSIRTVLPISTQLVSTTTTETIRLTSDVSNAHRVILANTSGTKTIQLPTGAYDGETFEIIRIGGVSFILTNYEGKAMQKCTGTATVTSMTISSSGKYTCIYSSSASRWYIMRDDFVSF